MAVIHFAPALQHRCPAPPLTVTGETVHTALAAAFQHYPMLQSYILDDQLAVRKHVAIFLNGTPIQDRQRQTDPISPQSEIYVLQALSGG